MLAVMMMDLILCFVMISKNNNTTRHNILKINPNQAPRVFVAYKLNIMSTMTIKRNMRKHFFRNVFFVTLPSGTSEDKNPARMSGNTETIYPEKKTGFPRVDTILNRSVVSSHGMGSQFRY
jgi:hypothetical protein